MTVLSNAGELESIKGRLVQIYVEDCLTSGKIPRDFVELIKHNFYAKFVAYDHEEKVVEVGINETKDNSSVYPDIQIYRYSLKETEWLRNSFRKNPFDLEYYQKLLRNKKSVA